MECTGGKIVMFSISLYYLAQAQFRGWSQSASFGINRCCESNERRRRLLYVKIDRLCVLQSPVCSNIHIYQRPLRKTMGCKFETQAEVRYNPFSKPAKHRTLLYRRSFRLSVCQSRSLFKMQRSLICHSVHGFLWLLTIVVHFSAYHQL